MKHVLMLLFTLTALACGDTEVKPFEFDETTPGGNNGTSNNGTSNNGTSNNGTSNNGTSNNGTSNNTSGCSIPEPEVHRATAEACDDTRPDGSGTDEGIGGGDCTADSDCTEGTNGRCSNLGRGYAACTYDECSVDSDCGTDSVCHCGGGWRSDANICKAGNCTVDSDCGAGGYCSPSLGECGNYGGVVGWFCRTCKDECVADSDCIDPSMGQGYCAYQGDRWSCSYAQCVG